MPRLSWDDASPNNGADNLFVKFRSEKSVTGIFCSDPFVWWKVFDERTERDWQWIPKDEADEKRNEHKAKKRASFSFWDVEMGAMRYLEAPSILVSLVAERLSGNDRVQDWVFKVTLNGMKYSVEKMRPATELDAENISNAEVIDVKSLKDLRDEEYQSDVPF